MSKINWNNYFFVIGIIFVIYLIYRYYLSRSKIKFNHNLDSNSELTSSIYESFDSKTSIEELKKSIAEHFGISEKRINNLSISGQFPSVQVKMTFLPRTVVQKEEDTLDMIQSKFEEEGIDAVFFVKDEDIRFTYLKMTPLEKLDVNMNPSESLKSLFVDKTINKQLRELKNIRDFVKYNSAMNHFYEFNDLGSLKLQAHPEFDSELAENSKVELGSEVELDEAILPENSEQNSSVE